MMISQRLGKRSLRVLQLAAITAALLLGPKPGLAQNFADVSTDQGSYIAGRLPDDAAFQFDGSLGRVRLEPSKIQSIMFSGGKAAVTLRDNSVLNGEFGTAPIKLTWAGGEVEIPIERVNRIDFLACTDGKLPRGATNRDFLALSDLTISVSVQHGGVAIFGGTITDLDAFDIECDLGKVHIPVHRILTIDFSLDPPELRTDGGSILHGKISPASFHLKYEGGESVLEVEKLDRLSVSGAPIAGVPEPAPPVKPPPAEKPPTPPSSDIWPEDWKPGTPVPFKGALVGRPVLSDDRSRLVSFDSATRSVVVIATASMTVAQNIEVPIDLADLSIAPGIATAFGCAGETVIVVDIAGGRVTSRFKIEHQLRSIIALSDDVAIGVTDSAGLLVLSASRQGIIRKSKRLGQGAVYVPERRSLYVDGWRFTFPANVGKAEKITLGGEVTAAGMPPGWATSDGRFLANQWGGCYRLGVVAAVAIRPVPPVPAEVTAAADFPTARRWFLFRRKDVAEIALPSLTITKFRPMPEVAMAALADENARALYVFTGRAEGLATNSGGIGPLKGPGNWIRVEIDVPK